MKSFSALVQSVFNTPDGMDLLKTLLRNNDNHLFDADPLVMSYNIGKRDAIRELISELSRDLKPEERRTKENQVEDELFFSEE